MSTSIALENLTPVLLQTFSIILLGYLMGRFGAIDPKEVSGLGAFLSKESAKSAHLTWRFPKQGGTSSAALRRHGSVGLVNS